MSIRLANSIGILAQLRLKSLLILRSNVILFDISSVFTGFLLLELA